MFSIRPATLEDAGVIAAQRRAMFRDMGHHDNDTLDAMAALSYHGCDAR